MHLCGIATKPRKVGAGVCSTNRNAKPRENALSISITDSENLELEEEAYKACWVALVFFRDTRICRRCNEGNIFLAMHSHDREKKRPQQTEFMILGRLEFEF